MKIAKIVSSNSHIAYIARVLDERDGHGVPSPDSYGFGRFVSIDANDEEVIGVICDSRLVNPEYSNFSPNIGHTSTLGELKRDLVNERKALVAILLLGRIADGAVRQEIPHRVLPAGQFVETLEPTEVAQFHLGVTGRVQMHYLPDLMANAGPLAIPLVKTVIAQLGPHCSGADKQRLEVMGHSLSWKHTLGENRF